MTHLISLALALSAPAAPQAVAETPLGTGFEPFVLSNRRPNDVNNRDRVNVMWLDGLFADHPGPVGRPTPTIYRRFSTDQGGTWTPSLGQNPEIVYDSMFEQLDPTLAANYGNGDMYHGWQQKNASGGRFVETRATDYTLTLPGDSDVVGGLYRDRPWMVASVNAAYMSWVFVQTNQTGFDFLIKRATVSTGPNITWPTGNGTPWYSSLSGRTAQPSPIIAVDPQPGEAVADYVYGLALDHRFAQPPFSGELRLYRSLDAGNTWAQVSPVLVDFLDNTVGFNKFHEGVMGTYHISADPSTSSNWVYVFYVRTVKAVGQPAGPSGGEPFAAKWQVLYCKRSSDSGATWSSPIIVQSGQDLLPANGYADIPVDGTNYGPGFYRAGRVWSTVDSMGRVHVVWFDNRAGRYPPDIVSGGRRELWDVYYSTSTNNGATWSAALRLSSASSLSNFGNPFGRNAEHRPPGDYISCDADNNFFYAAWPDTRTYPLDPVTRVYLAQVPLP